MALFDLLKNTVEGAIQVPLGGAKVVIGSATAILDDGATLDAGIRDLKQGIDKIGSAEKQGKG